MAQKLIVEGENDIEAVNYDLDEMKLALETNLEMR